MKILSNVMKFFERLELSGKSIDYLPIYSGFKKYIQNTFPNWDKEVVDDYRDLHAILKKTLENGKKLVISLTDGGTGDEMYLNMGIPGKKTKKDGIRNLTPEQLKLNSILSKYSNKRRIFLLKCYQPEEKKEDFIKIKNKNSSKLCIEGVLRTEYALVSTVNSLVDVMNEYYNIKKEVK